MSYAARATLPAEATGSIAEAAGGIAIIILSIIGLARADAAPLASIAVVVLGAPSVLAPVSVIAAGAMMLMSAPLTSQFAEVRRQAQEMPETTRMLMRAATTSSCGLQMIAGLAAVVLGILAVSAGGATGTGAYAHLTLVALLVLGAGLVLSTSVMSGGMVRLFSRR